MPSSNELGMTQWKLAGQFVFTKEAKGTLPATLAYPFKKRIVKVSSESKSTAKIIVNERWRRAGYLKQVASNQELCSRVVPLNQSTILVFPLLTSSYYLVFVPVTWLPNLTIKVWEYTGVESEVLIQEATLLM